MNSSAPFLPPTSDYFAGTSGAAWSFPTPNMSQPGGFPVVMPADSKSLAASKTHREAERLRRKRINDHLSTLRTLLPNLLKTDKASLLTEAVRRLRELKEETSQLTTPSEADEKLLPEDMDSVSVRRCDVNGGVLVATLSCEERPELLSDLSRALKTVKAKLLKAEMATVGGRTKVVLRLQDQGMGPLSRTLRVVIDRPTSTGYGSIFGLFGPKRQRIHR